MHSDGIRYINLADESESGSGSNSGSESPDDPDDPEEAEEKDDSDKPMLFESFKMALYREEENYGDGDIRDVLEAKDGRKWNTAKVFVAALREMKRHIFETFESKDVRVKDTTTGKLRQIGGIGDVQWILTVPAIWSDRAKFKMERWAQNAGLIDGDILEHLRIVYEPDCASISCQYEAVDEEKEMNQGDASATSAFAAGTRYILIDAGGGMLIE